MKDQNSFLYALSSLGAMNSNDYNREFSNLCLETELSEDVNVRVQKNRFLKKIQSLGHIEVSANRTIFICAPLITLVRDGARQLSVLTGARTPYLIEKIFEHIERESDLIDLFVVEQRHPLTNDGVKLLLPDAIFIRSNNIERVRELSKAIHIECQVEHTVSELLLGYAKGLGDYQKTLIWDKRMMDDPVSSKTHEFSLEKLSFIEKRNEGVNNQLAKYIFSEHIYESWLWKSGRGTKVRMDWGRFLFLNINQKDVLIYNKDSEWLAVPSYLSLPRLLSKILTLCSGLAPLEVRSGDLSRYGLPQGIPFEVYFLVKKSVAEQIAILLGQQLIENEITPHPDLCTLIPV